MKAVKTEHGIRLSEFGGFDGLRAFLDAVHDIIESENETPEVDENLNDECGCDDVCDCDDVCEDSDDDDDLISIDDDDPGEDVTAPELNSFEHVVSIAYDDDSDIVSITRDCDASAESVCAALLYALSLLLPEKTELDTKLKKQWHTLGGLLQTSLADEEDD